MCSIRQLKLVSKLRDRLEIYYDARWDNYHRSLFCKRFDSNYLNSVASMIVPDRRTVSKLIDTSQNIQQSSKLFFLFSTADANHRRFARVTSIGALQIMAVSTISPLFIR